MTSRDPKGAGGCTVGYPSDSLASCKVMLIDMHKNTARAQFSTFKQIVSRHILESTDLPQLPRNHPEKVSGR